MNGRGVTKGEREREGEREGEREREREKEREGEERPIKSFRNLRGSFHSIAAEKREKLEAYKYQGRGSNLQDF